MKARRYGIWAGLAIVAAITSGALLAQAPQAIGTWVSVGDLSSPLTNGAAVALPDKRTLIAGGALADGTLTDAVTIYDSVDDSATATGTLTSARADHTATLLKDGRVLVVGGMTADGLVSSDIEIFDPATGTSAIVALLPEPRNGHVAAALPNGNVLIAGGATVDGAILQTAVLFDPETSGVSSVPGHLHTARVHASATTMLDGRVLVAGGSNGTTELASAEIYDRYSQSFSMAATQMSVGRQGHSAVLLPDNGGVLVAGGTSNGVAQAGVDLFLPAVFPDPFSYGEGEFTATGAMTAARSRAVVGPTSSEGFAFAAAGGAPDAEVYRFATIKTDKDDYAPGELAVITGSGWQPNEEVTLLFQEDPAVHDDYVLKVNADGNGNIFWNQWAPERHDLGVRFYLTATGSASRAQTTFTDGLKVTVKPNNQNLVVAGGAKTSVTFEINNDNNGSDSNIPITVNYALTAASSLSVSGAPLTGTVTLADSSAFSTLTFDVTAPAGPASGLTVTLAVTIAGCSTSNCSDSGKYNFDVTAPTDSTSPVITPTVTGTLGSNGWYRSDVKVSWAVTDPESTITSSPCGDTTITSDTTGTVVTCSATSAGGTSTQSVTIKRDATAPSVTATRTPGANANGWNNTNVTVTFAGTDALSGIDTCDAAAQLTTEGSNLSASGNCVDKAGNTGSASLTGIKIDKTAPAISASRLPLANSFGWNNADVTASYTASDALSGLSSPDADSYIFSAEGAGQSHTFTVTDKAGNTAEATVSNVNIDKTAPAVTATPAPAANAAGWNNSDVTVTFAGTDALSGIDSCQAPTVLSTEGANQSASGSCTDKAGNSAPMATASGINIDKTAPAISASRLPAANAFGWNNIDVTASYTASDALSGLSSPDADSYIFSAEGAGQSHTFTVTDKAGNTAEATVSNVNIDKTAPAVTATPAPAANAAGWNNSDVTVTFAGTDALSGIDSCQAPTVLSTEGANQSASGSCTDKAGNSAPMATASGINIDKTAPAISASRLPAANAFGWNNIDVTASYTASDALSGLSSPDADSYIFSAEGAGQSHTFTVTDKAGNTAEATVSNVNIDKTAPAVTATPAPAANAAGWNNSDVTVTFAGTDALSGIDSCQAPTVLSTEGANQSASGSCTDKAGNSAPMATASGINIDKTAPAISASRLPAANAFGWNNIDVTASYTASDALSGLSSPDADSYIFSAEGAGQSHTFTVTDKAGNTAEATVSNVNIDKTAPAVTATPAPAANAAGWNNSDVTVTFAGTDALSGIDSCQAPTVLSTEGANQSASGSCTDKAGNSAPMATASGINIDKTAPAISASRLPAANAFGWNNIDVTASYTASDALSGLSSPDADSYIFSAEGAGQSHTFTVTDKAGNTAEATVSNVNIDKTAPAVTATPAPAANAAGWNNSDVTVTFAGTDALSGIDSCQAPTVLSTEGANQSASGSCTDKAGNSAPMATASGINIDKTAPAITGGRLPLANAFGWNNTDVTATYEATDALSGFAGWAYGNGTHTFTAEGAGQSYTFTGTDKAGNNASATVSGINIDKTAPTLAPVVSPNPVILNGTATATPNATDGLSGIQYESCPAVSTSSVGSQTLTCTATDKAGNVGTSATNYSVNYSWQGFSQPINDTAHQTGATQSKFKLGQTVPAKFVLRDAAGVSVQQGSNPAFLISSNLGSCTSYTTLELTEAATPDALPVYRWDGAQYHFNWSTKGLSGGVYRIYAKLADGNQPWVDICLTK